ncbi:MAG: trypsin-like peptidase domain-containing protein [Candidatus Pacebacteria bacterium]|nr:trypsin-like peptidase domain-containing protein [Candidatus Paceibacterota bacterium]
MSIYQLPELNIKRLEAPAVNGVDKKKAENKAIPFFIIFILGILFGGAMMSYGYPNFKNNSNESVSASALYSPQTTQEDAVIKTVNEASDSVVSVIISKEVPVYKPIEENVDPNDPFSLFNFGIPKYEKDGTEVKEVGQGTGFFVSEDGMLLTNKHVASDPKAEYTIITNQGKEYKAKILARDPVQDLAILKVNSTDKFKSLRLGESGSIRVGQTAIAIGNALGEFQNTVSVGVISGLGRTITASGIGTSETLEDTIQTDAAINQGNSGGPLLNLKGEVIGINTAVSSVGQGLGFAISIDKAKNAIEQTKKNGKISYPFLGIRYVLLDEKVAKLKKVSITDGVLVTKGDKDEPAVSSGSPAEGAGIKEGDIITEVDGERITKNNSLSKIIKKYSPGDTITLKILRDGSYIAKAVRLGEWENN